MKTNSKSTLIDINDIHNHESDTIENLNLLEIRGKCMRRFNIKYKIKNST